MKECMFYYCHKLIILFSYKLIAIASQCFLEEIANGIAESITSKKNNNKFLEAKELNEIIKVKQKI